MKFIKPVPASWINEKIEGEIIGLQNAEATGINEIHKVENGDITFVDHPKYYDKVLNSEASFIIINKSVEAPEGKTLFFVENPFEAYCKIVEHFRPFVVQTEMISSDLKKGNNTFIYPNVFIGKNVSIGDNCIIYPNVSIMDHTIIGNNVIIHPGVVIGGNSFYYNTKKDREVWYKKMPDCGRVIIEDDVEIGANCTIDRGVSAETVIGKGSKMDNLIHVGHDTVIGKNCLFAAQTGIAGVVNIGDGVTVWGQCGISKTLSIGNNATLLAMTGVNSDLQGGKIYWGVPAEEASNKKRELVWIKRIPQLWEKIMNK